MKDSSVQGLALAIVLNVVTFPPILIGSGPGRWVWIAGVVSCGAIAWFQ